MKVLQYTEQHDTSADTYKKVSVYYKYLYITYFHRISLHQCIAIAYVNMRFTTYFCCVSNLYLDPIHCLNFIL